MHTELDLFDPAFSSVTARNCDTHILKYLLGTEHELYGAQSQNIFKQNTYNHFYKYINISNTYKFIPLKCFIYKQKYF